MQRKFKNVDYDFGLVEAFSLEQIRELLKGKTFRRIKNSWCDGIEDSLNGAIKNTTGNINELLPDSFCGSIRFNFKYVLKELWSQQ